MGLATGLSHRQGEYGRADVTGHVTRTLVVSVVGLALLGGCGRHRQAHAGSIRQLKKSDMSAAELKYGIAPVPDATVTYQPEVIVVGGGGEAIRAQSPNG